MLSPSLSLSHASVTARDPDDATIRRPSVDNHRLDDEQRHEFVHRHLLEPPLVGARVEDRLLLFWCEAAREVDAEFLQQQRYAFLAAARMAQRVFDFDFLQDQAGLSAADAYALARLSVDFRVGEAVNNIKMVYGMIPKKLFGKNVPLIQRG